MDQPQAKPPEKSLKPCPSHEMADYGNADRLYQAQGMYWAEYTCIHCGRKFSIVVPNIVGQ